MGHYSDHISHSKLFKQFDILLSYEDLGRTEIAKLMSTATVIIHPRRQRYYPV